MKSRYYISLLAAMILGLASMGYAQQTPFNAETGNVDADAAQALAQTPVSPAYTAYQYFNPEIGNASQPAPASPSALHRHAGIVGNLAIVAPTKLGGITLSPGEYMVQHVSTDKEHFVEFSRMVENDFAAEGTSPYQRQVVAQVNCTREPLNTSVARTELQPKTAGTTASLEIRGEKAVHLF